MIALIAGTGALPAILVDRLSASGDVPIICELEGFRADISNGVPKLAFRLETLGSLLKTLATMGVTRICMAGAIRRPVIDPAAIDAETQHLVPILMQALSQGDDGALRAIIGIFENKGFSVVAAHSLAPDLIPEAGVLTAALPDASHSSDADVGERLIALMGRADQGQACVIRDGTVLAQEGPAGTDAMLDALAVPSTASSNDPVSWVMDTASDLIGGAADWLSNAAQSTPGVGAILFKAAKPGQDRRADLPVIGPETAARVVQLGLAGIVVEAGSVMVLDQAKVVKTLDAAGKFLWVRPRGDAS